MGNAVHPEDENHERGGGAGLLAGTGGPSAEPPHLSAFYLDQPQPGLERDYSPSRPPGQFASSPSATLTVPRPVPQHPPDEPGAQYSIRSVRTWPQRVGGILIAAAVVAGDRKSVV